jgi:hypothetical protein
LTNGFKRPTLIQAQVEFVVAPIEAGLKSESDMGTQSGDRVVGDVLSVSEVSK